MSSLTSTAFRLAALALPVSPNWVPGVQVMKPLSLYVPTRCVDVPSVSPLPAGWAWGHQPTPLRSCNLCGSVTVMRPHCRHF